MKVNNPFTGQSSNLNPSGPMDDKQNMLDSLSTQKLISGEYNTHANECANQNLKNDFINILKEEHQIQYDLFCEAQNRGWYQVAPAEQQKVDQAKQKFASMQ